MYSGGSVVREVANQTLDLSSTIAEYIVCSLKVLVDLVHIVEESAKHFDIGSFGIGAVGSEIPIEVTVPIDDYGW